MRHRRLPLAVAVAATTALALSACEPLGGDGPGHGYYLTPGEGDHGGGGEGEEVPSTAGDGASAVDATATVVDATGAELGTVTVTEDRNSVVVEADLEGLPPGGFHGFHVHETGVCQPASAAADAPTEIGDFLSAGGHLDTGDGDHPQHAGDMPSLLVQQDGTASLRVHLDRVTMADLMDDDGSAFIVHADPDNFANIPERYAPEGPDQDTLDTGDSGDRVACGVLEADPVSAS